MLFHLKNIYIFFSFEIGVPEENDGHCINILETEPEAPKKTVSVYKVFFLQYMVTYTICRSY
jgi:hypothetical protein